MSYCKLFASIHRIQSHCPVCDDETTHDEVLWHEQLVISQVCEEEWLASNLLTILRQQQQAGRGEQHCTCAVCSKHGVTTRTNSCSL